MLQPRLGRSAVGIEASLSSLASCLQALNICRRQSRAQPLRIFTRNASHATQGRANGPGDSAGRRLGAKKSASEHVIPGNIIFKQRGTKWHPGENCDIGKDHTIFAKVAGYVRYYRDPRIHPKRRYIGVALERDGPMSQLPTPPNAPKRRRLGMYASPIEEDVSATFLQDHLSENSKESSTSPASAKKPTIALLPPIMRPGTYRIANYEIGKAAERKGVVIKEYDRGNRWLAWRKRTRKVKLAALARAAKATRKTKGKKVNKGMVNKAPPRRK